MCTSEKAVWPKFAHKARSSDPIAPVSRDNPYHRTNPLRLIIRLYKGMRRTGAAGLDVPQEKSRQEHDIAV